MSNLINNSTPAERAVGARFAENFETAQAVVKNGGTITGTPVIDNGATNFLGNISNFIIHDKTLTPLQIADLDIKTMANINKV